MTVFLAHVLLLLFIGMGFVGVVLNLIGTFFILLGAVLFSWMTGLVILEPKTLAWLLVFYLAGEASDFLFTLAGAKKFGASPWSIVSGMGGGTVGALAGSLYLGFGALFGAFVGIFLGIFVTEMLIRKKISLSAKAAAGGVAGAFGALFVKLTAACLMTGMILVQIISYWSKS